MKPELLAHDMHPGYLSTAYAREQSELPTVAVQHHHAHMAACMCEHGLTEPVLGVIFDGTGYGTDGKIWGGEFLVGDYAGFERAAQLEYCPLPGGDRAVEEPFRVALALLQQAHGSFAGLDLPVVARRSEEERHVLGRMIEQGVNSPLELEHGAAVRRHLGADRRARAGPLRRAGGDRAGTAARAGDRSRAAARLGAARRGVADADRPATAGARAGRRGGAGRRRAGRS